jgi:hypothetical protein
MLLILLACEPKSTPEPQDDTAADTDRDSAADPDLDGDGYGASVDCDDADSAVHPDATEVCNERDDDCDGAIDNGAGTAWYVDSDGDGYRDVVGVVSCTPSGDATPGDDCDDTDDAVHPDASEACGDTQDYDCDGWAAACTLDDVPHATILGDTRFESLYNQMDLSGDLDGDGHADLVMATVQTTYYEHNWSVLSVYSGDDLLRGAELTASASPNWTTQDRRCGAEGDDVDFGSSVTYVGDVDGGGGDDVVVASDGCPLAPGGTALWVFRGEQFGSDWSMDMADAAVLLTDDTEDGWRTGVEALVPGDFDGDGRGDVVAVGLISTSLFYLQDIAEWGDGRSLQEAASGTVSCPDSIVLTPESSGDYNGDGQDDLAWFQVDDPDHTWVAYVNLHSPLGSETAADADLRLDVSADLGIGVGEPGDIDDDGYADLLLNVWSDKAKTNVYLYSGAELGTVSSVSDWTWQVPEAASWGSVGDTTGDGKVDLEMYFYHDAPEGEFPMWIVPGADVVAGLDTSRIRGPLVDGRLSFLGSGHDVDGDGANEFLGWNTDFYNDDQEEYYVLFGG